MIERKPYPIQLEGESDADYIKRRGQWIEEDAEIEKANKAEKEAAEHKKMIDAEEARIAADSEIYDYSLKCPGCGKVKTGLKETRGNLIEKYRYAPYKSAIKVYEIACTECKNRESNKRICEYGHIPERYMDMEIDDFEANTPELSEVKNTIIRLIEQRSWVVLIGSIGTGKTHLGICMLKAGIRSNRSGIYLSAASFLPYLVRSGFDHNRIWDDKIVGRKIIMLDDIGQGEELQREGETNERIKSEFSTIIDLLYRNNGQLIITTNVPSKTAFVKRYAMWGSDRILECGEFVVMPNIPSRRPSIGKQGGK